MQFFTLFFNIYFHILPVQKKRPKQSELREGEEKKTGMSSEKSVLQSIHRNKIDLWKPS